MKVVCDTNVILSAIIFGGNPEKIIVTGLHGSIELISSEEILKGCQRKLKGKFKWNKTQVQTAISFLNTVFTTVQSDFTTDMIKKDPPDNRILECAYGASAHYIISGDKHYLLPLKIFRQIPILSPAEFLTSVLYRE